MPQLIEVLSATYAGAMGILVILATLKYLKVKRNLRTH